MFDQFLEAGAAVLMVLGGLYTLGLIVAPKTKTKVDDKIVAILGKAKGFLAKLLGKK
jgi:hypothetical protein